jgi:L-rhamnose mutarotase
MSKSNIRNFTIYFHKETSTMFQHFEWIGHWGGDALTEAEEKAIFDSDMQAIADDPVTKVWWTECEPCQEPFSQWPKGAPPPSQGGAGDWWAPLVCLNHCGHWSTDYASGLRDPDLVAHNPDGKTTCQPKIE